MKIVFLDFDGVLNSHEWFRAHHDERGLGHLDPAACARVQRLCDETGANIVVSSTWRLLHRRVALCDMLRARGVTARVVGMTPHPVGDSKRGDEIGWWLASNPAIGVDVIDGMVIIDDDSDMAHLAPWHVKTYFDRGFTDYELGKAIEMLSRPMPTDVSPDQAALSVRPDEGSK